MAVPASTQNGSAQRLSSQGSGGSVDDQQTAVSPGISDPGSDAALPPAEPQDISDLYSRPMRVIGRQQAQGEPGTANDEAASYPYGGPYLDDRKSSLTGDRTAISSVTFS